MTTTLRQERILELLGTQGAVSVKALMKILYVSEATVRRDLSELEKSGLLKRTRGGAEPINYVYKQVPIYIRESLDSQEKNEICKKAAEFIHDGDTIFIDGSSTALHLANHLSHLNDITAVTYSIRATEILCQNHVKTYCIGGLIMENSLVCMGQQAIEMAERFNVDVCFIACKGLSLDGRFSDTSEEETAIRRVFIKNAKKVIFMMTNNKIGNTYLHTLCNMSDVDTLISNAELPDELLGKLRHRS